jgi:hypothetical protein
MGIFIMKNPKTKKERLEYFAGLAMQSLILRVDIVVSIQPYIIDHLACTAIKIAQEMIKQIDENEQI